VVHRVIVEQVDIQALVDFQEHQVIQVQVAIQEIAVQVAIQEIAVQVAIQEIAV
jgi:hypothetical protein